MRTITTIALTAALALSISCGDQPGPQLEPTQQGQLEWMLEHAPSYLSDTSWRRTELEASLWRPELPYARKRLAGYALEDGGWDLLPTIDARVEPVRAGGAPAATFAGRDITPEQTPQTIDEWLALGEEVFWSMPMRRDAYLEWVVDRPELWDEVGLQARDDGTLRGVVRFEDARGELRAAATCGLCHGDQGQAGRATRALDLGKGRALFARARGADPGEYDHWGAGRVDVTDDGVTDALTIPDLWGVSHQSHLNASGAVRVASPAALAIRFETQYIVGHSMEARPQRELTWALAMYVLSLEPAADERAGSESGKELFEQSCAHCHRPEDGFSGDLVLADLLPSDPQAAHSALRGTGYYKVPSLIGASGGGPYLHDSSAPTLRALLDSGHGGAADMTDARKDELIDYLDSL